MSAVPTSISPQVPQLATLKVRAADAPAAAVNVDVVDVEARVHHADWNTLAGEACKLTCGVAVLAQGIGTHDGYRGVVGGLHDRDRFDGHDEVGLGECGQRAVGHVGGVGS